MPTKDYNSNTRRYEERESSKATGFDLKTAGGAATRSAAGLGAAASAQKTRPKAPQRSAFASDEAYSAAYRKYREAMMGDTDTVAQKRALGRMK